MSDDIKRLKEEEQEDFIYVDVDKEDALIVSDDSSSPSRRKGKSHHEKWVGGLILIGIGLVFLLQNVTTFAFDNWWALFILIPGVASLVNAWQNYQEDGRFSERARGPFIGGLILMFIASIFIFGWSWGTVWPVFLIIAGFGALLKGVLD